MTSYALIMLLAVATGILVSRLTRQPTKLSSEQRLAIGLGGFCGAMIGAKLPFLLADPQGLVSGAAWFSDGKTILFGFVGGYIGVELIKWTLDIHEKTGDSFAVPVAAAVAVGRLACFVGGCCYGTVTNLPWGCDFGDGLKRHPTQIYESLFHAIAAVVLYVLLRRGLIRGQLIKIYFIAYFIFRFLTETIRPEARLWLGLTGYQWSCLVLIAAFAALWARDKRRLKLGLDQLTT